MSGLDVRRDGRTVLLRPAGSMVRARVDQWSRLIAEAVPEGCDLALIDLGGVDFIDSSGIGMLLSFHRDLRSQGTGLAFCSASGMVRRLFERLRIGFLLFDNESDARWNFDPLDVSVNQVRPDTATITLEGMLKSHVADKLMTPLDRLSGSAVANLTLDLSGLAYMDPAVSTDLRRWAEQAVWRDRRIRVVAAPEQLEALFTDPLLKNLVDTAAPESGAGDGPQTPARVGLHREGDITIMRIRGWLRHGGVERLRRELGRAVGEKPRGIVLDLGECPDMDSAAVGAVMFGYRQAGEAGVGIAIADANPRLRRLFEITGIENVIPVHPDVDRARRDLKSRA